MRKKAKFVNVCQLWSLDGHYANMLIGQYFLVLILKHQKYSSEIRSLYLMKAYCGKTFKYQYRSGVNQGK